MILKNSEKKENGLFAFTIEVDAKEFEKAVNSAYLKSRKDIFVQGFRKGKAPRMVIEGMYGSDVFYDEAVNILAPGAFAFGAEKESLKAVGNPSITDYTVGEDKSVTVSFETALYPEVTLGQYKGLSAEKPSIEVTEEEIDAEIQKARRRASRIVSVDRPAQMGDNTTIDFKGYMDGEAFEGGTAEKYVLILGSEQFVPGFEEQVVGMAPGEDKDINIVFPEDYHDGFAGKAATFKVHLHEVKETVLPDFDDEFVKDVSEFDTIDEYKADLKKNLEEDHAKQSESEFQSELIKKACENMTAEIPECMVEDKKAELKSDFERTLTSQGLTLDAYLQLFGMDAAAYDIYMNAGAKAQVQSDVLLAAVAEAENIEATEEEMEAEYKSMSETYSVDVDVVKKSISGDYVSENIKMRKAAQLIYDSGVVAEPEKKEEAAAEEKTEEAAE